MKKENITILNQLLRTLEQLESKLESYYNKKDLVKFNKSKKSMLELQKQVSNLLK